MGKGWHWIGADLLIVGDGSVCDYVLALADELIDECEQLCAKYARFGELYGP